jgi:hypothetical protein
MNTENVATTTTVTGTPVTASAPVMGTTTGEIFNPPTTAAAPAEVAQTAPDAGQTQQPTATATKPQTPRRVQLSTSELNDRIARAKAAAFRDVFGTDDVNEIRSKMQRAEELEKQAEASRLAQMSEVERAKHEAQKARQEATRYRAELARTKEREIVRDQQSVIERLASRHVDSNYIEEASVAFARDIANRDPKEVASYGEKDISKWFQNYVARKPAFAASPKARRSEVKPASAPTPPPRPATPSNASTNTPAKYFHPGRANSMTAAEAKAEARRLGYSW